MKHTKSLLIFLTEHLESQQYRTQPLKINTRYFCAIYVKRNINRVATINLTVATINLTNTYFSASKKLLFQVKWKRVREAAQMLTVKVGVAKGIRTGI